MNKHFYVICNKARHAWLIASKVVLGTGISRCGDRATDACMAEALEKIEEESLSWVMQVHDRSTIQDHRQG